MRAAYEELVGVAASEGPLETSFRARYGWRGSGALCQRMKIHIAMKFMDRLSQSTRRVAWIPPCSKARIASRKILILSIYK